MTNKITTISIGFFIGILSTMYLFGTQLIASNIVDVIKVIVIPSIVLIPVTAFISKRNTNHWLYLLLPIILPLLSWSLFSINYNLQQNKVSQNIIIFTHLTRMGVLLFPSLIGLIIGIVWNKKELKGSLVV